MARKALRLQISNSTFQKAECIVLGVPDDSGSSYRHGSALAPDAIRKFASHTEVAGVKRRSGVSMFNPEFRKFSARVHDCGNVGRGSLKKMMEKIGGARKFPLTIGGDHSITYTALSGLSRGKKFSLIYLDAHPDFICSSGNYFGSVMCDISRLKNADMKSSIIVGARALEDEEIDEMKDSGIKVITATDIAELGAKRVVDMIRNTVSSNAYMSIDMDVVDPAFAPGVTTPISGGISAAELLYMARELAGKATLGCDIMEVCPELDVGNRTLDLAYRLILEILSAK